LRNAATGRSGRLDLPGPYRGLRIGLFGGSFNPAHAGHRHVAETALKRLQLDHVWWLVARGNPLKETHGVYAARYASAARLADHPRMGVTDLEAQLGVSYTSDLFDRLGHLLKEGHFVWVMGADNLSGFHRWGDWEGIAATIPIAVIARPGASPKAGLSKFARRFAQYRVPETDAARLPDYRAPAWTVLTAPWHNASSTALRAAARARNPFRRRRGLNPR